MTYPEPPLAGDETATLLGSLERQRATLAWKCGELDAAVLKATIGPDSRAFDCPRVAARCRL